MSQTPDDQPSPDDFRVSFEPDPLAASIAAALVHDGFTVENAWLLATRAANHELDWHRAGELLATGKWSQLDIVRVLV